MIVFVVPVHQRHTLATICLRQLRRVCKEIGDATAVVVGDDRRFMALTQELGFHWCNSRNEPLGRKWNDGYQYAGLRLNADYLVPLGSDDIVHPSLFDDLPKGDTIACTRHSAIVSPDGCRIAILRIPYPGGDGVRIFPRRVLERMMFRPCLEDKPRAIDGSITTNLTINGAPPRFEYRNTNPLAIIDFKTDTPDQRNSYQSCLTFSDRERSDVKAAVSEWHGEQMAADLDVIYRVKVAA